MEITLEQLKLITKQKESILIPFVNPLNDTLKQFAINTPIRQAFFIAQVTHESGSFRYTEELASGSAYENRADLGNVNPGDGKYFKGRGIVQITGRNNYKKLSDSFGVDFISNPKLLKTPEWACKSAGWFWDSKKLNEYADKRYFLYTTYLINGGQNGLEERLKFLNRSSRIFNVDRVDVILNDIFSQIETNISKTRTTHFEKMLFKAVPTKQILDQIKISLKNS